MPHAFRASRSKPPHPVIEVGGRGDRFAHCAMAPVIAVLALSPAAAPQVPSGASVRASHSSAEAKSEFTRAAQMRNSLVDRKSTRLNSSHLGISYAVFCLKKKINIET